MSVVDSMIEQAIESERERCAKIAEDWPSYPPSWSSKIAMVPIEIAKAIRAGRGTDREGA